MSDSALYDSLKSWRLQRAQAIQKPAFVVFSNAVLVNIATAKPTHISDLARVSGVGPQKLREYGDDVLRIVREHNTKCMATGETANKRLSQTNTVDLTPPAKAARVVCAPGAGGSQTYNYAPPTPSMLWSKAPMQTATSTSKTQKLTTSQSAALARVVDGKNVFITGDAGTGKSFLLRNIVEALETRGTVAVTASTGIAASHIGGQTIHSWAGIGLGKGNQEKLLEKVLGNAAAIKRWQSASALVLDEVSMLDGKLFGALDVIARAARASASRPFGGLQLILVGDFFQLPPVSLGYAGFAFESSAWDACGIEVCILREQMRQGDDSNFASILKEIRIGVCTPATEAALAACHVSRKARPTDGILPTRLYCKNANVDAENATQLGKLPGEEAAFMAKDVPKGTYDDATLAGLTQALDKKAPMELALKVGAQVLLVKNWPQQKLVNGSRGIVAGFEKRAVDPSSSHLSYGITPGEYTVPLVRFDDGVVRAITPASFFGVAYGGGGAGTRTQIPLKLAWALTVHKAQGMTLSRCEIQVADAFAAGQAYVALSRCVSLAGLWIAGAGVNQSAVKAHAKVLAFYGRHGG